jgi:hypothetical protein
MNTLPLLMVLEKKIMSHHVLCTSIKVFVVSEYPRLIGTLILKEVDEAALLKSGKVLWS